MDSRIPSIAKLAGNYEWSRQVMTDWLRKAESGVSRVEFARVASDASPTGPDSQAVVQSFVDHVFGHKDAWSGTGDELAATMANWLLRSCSAAHGGVLSAWGDLPTWVGRQDAVRGQPASFAGVDVDHHVHTGGVLSWGWTWESIMTGKIPVAFFGRPSWRELPKGSAIPLLGFARRLRKELMERVGIPRAIQGAEGSEDLLVARMLQDKSVGTVEGLSYVLVRHLFRMECSYHHMDNLDDFVGGFWTRFHGKAPKGLSARVARIDALRCKAAVQQIRSSHMTQSSLRANISEGSRRSTREAVRSMEQALSEFTDGPFTIFHLPKQTPRLGRGFGAGGLGSLFFLDRVDADRFKSRLIKSFQFADRVREWRTADGFDLAGSERTQPLGRWRAMCEALVEASSSRHYNLRNHAGEDFREPVCGLARVALWISAASRATAKPRRPVTIGHGCILGINPFAGGRTRYLAPLWESWEAEMAASWLDKHQGEHWWNIPYLTWNSNFGWQCSTSGTQWKSDSSSSRLPPVGHFDEHTAVANCEIDSRQFNHRWRAIGNFVKLQKKVVDFCRSRDVAVEAMPTSNVAIFGYGGYHEVAFWGQVAQGLRVVVATDNPGMFGTSLRDELTNLRRAFDDRRRFEEPMLQTGFLEHQCIGSVGLTWQEIEERVVHDTLTLRDEQNLVRRSSRML